MMCQLGSQNVLTTSGFKIRDPWSKVGQLLLVHHAEASTRGRNDPRPSCTNILLAFIGTCISLSHNDWSRNDPDSAWVVYIRVYIKFLRDRWMDDGLQQTNRCNNSFLWVLWLTLLQSSLLLLKKRQLVWPDVHIPLMQA